MAGDEMHAAIDPHWKHHTMPDDLRHVEDPEDPRYADKLAFEQLATYEREVAMTQHKLDEAHTDEDSDRVLRLEKELANACQQLQAAGGDPSRFTGKKTRGRPKAAAEPATEEE